MHTTLLSEDLLSGDILQLIRKSSSSSRKLGDDMKDSNTQKYKKFNNRVVNLKESERSTVGPT